MMSGLEAIARAKDLIARNKGSNGLTTVVVRTSP